MFYANVSGIRQTGGSCVPRRMGYYEDCSLFCFCTVVFDDTAGCGIGLYRVSDFDYCRDYRFCLIAGLGR